MPGRVDLWPAIAPTAKGDSGHWTDPTGQIAEEHHWRLMADRVAHAVRHLVDSECLWENDGGRWVPRSITEGDILILVQRRGPLFHEIIAAAKRQGLAVAGADVLRLGEELAVRDLLSLLSFLATPEDDLALAEALRSPLFNWTESELYDLAADRPDGYLWQALRSQAERWPETVARLRTLRDASDFLRPYDLLERILTRAGTRAALIARLGEEATDGIDLLLTEALSYEQEEAPSLTGFLARMEGTEIRIKRQAEARGSKLRVMTVHGSKGLESPIVILPDTGPQRRRAQIDDPVLADTSGLPIWRPPSNEMPANIVALRDTLSARRAEEGQRLLYVALTRAEQWLIAGVAGDLRSGGDSWAEQIEAGLLRRGAGPFAFSFGEGLRFASFDWTEKVEPPRKKAQSQTTAQAPELPSIPKPAKPAEPIAPSALGGAKALHGDATPEYGEEATERGSFVHLLLEHLPNYPLNAQPALAKRLLSTAKDLSGIYAEAQRVLTDAALAPVFAPGTLAEVPITAELPALNGARIRGTIDRLRVSDNQVLAVDFKSNAVVPDRPEDTPEGLLRQMGAYAHALSLLYPDREVQTALLWTRTCRLMVLPSGLIAAALTRARDTLAATP